MKQAVAGWGVREANSDGDEHARIDKALAIDSCESGECGGRAGWRGK